MANRELESLYDYDYEEVEEEPYFYSPRAAAPHDIPEDRMTVYSEEVSIPHRLEDTEYPVTQSVPFYADTTNKAAYTWKMPHGREKREATESELGGEVQKIPFYSETTHRSQYQPFDASIARTRLSRKTSALPTSNVPIETQTTYRNLFQELEIGKRQKLIQTCPAERLLHQTALLRKSRRENGHYFLSTDTLRQSKVLKASTSVRPTPLLKEPAHNEREEK